MSVLHTMTSAADAAGARYQSLVDGWEAIYERSLSDRDFGSAPLIERAGEEAYALARSYLPDEAVAAGYALREIATDALSAATSDLGITDARELTEAAGALLSETQHYLQREITIQVERDIAQLQQAMRQTALHVRLVAQAQGMTLRAALMQQRIGSSEGPAFYFRDRRSARWPSRLFVRTTWRQTLLSAFNEVTLSVLADAGIAFAEVHHASAKAGIHGMHIAFGPNTQLPAYGEVRNDIFHPNAEAHLVVPEQHRSGS